MAPFGGWCDTASQERFAMNIAGFPSLDETKERLPNAAAPDIGRAARAGSVRNAIAITMMEGGRPSAFCRELLALYEAGEISGTEMRERMLRKARGVAVNLQPPEALTPLDL
jgi:hypothetical protein